MRDFRAAAGTALSTHVTARTKEGRPRATCTARTKEGRPCRAPARLVRNGLCPVHSGSLDPAVIGRAGGLKSGVVRRRQAECVRRSWEEMRVQAGVAAFAVRRGELERELRARKELYGRKLGAELREELRGLRVEVRRLKRQRRRLRRGREER